MSSGSIEKMFEIPERLCGYIIGTKGSTIKEMQERHGVKLFFLDEMIICTKVFDNGYWCQPGKPLKAIGPPEKIAAVSKEIEKMLKHGLGTGPPKGW
uniref:K Homology domain-containing protein n=1 Tax=Panagrolaimus davidi TaxID=227884 RepID=A0A914QRH4_9BILA